MKLEPRKTYLDGWGTKVHIMGPTTTEEPRFWSIQGNHYTETGRLFTGYSNTNPFPTNAQNETRRAMNHDLVGVAPDQSWWEGM